MASKRSARLRTLMDGLKPIETTTKAEASGSSALHARAETPSAPPDNFDDHLCREMAASLWRYRAFLPRDFLRDTKAYLQLLSPNDADATRSKIRQFAMDFVYYFCTSAGNDSNQPVPEDAMAAAWTRMRNTVKGNTALENKLNSFMPRWRVLGQASAQSGEMPFPSKRASVAPAHMARLERELADILEWKRDGGHKAGAK